MTIQWFPGHMTKAKREMQENLKLVDLVIELRDCRIPLSSKNPMLDEIIQTKPRLIVLSKKDKGEAEITQQWIEKLKDDTTLVIAADLLHDSFVPKLTQACKEVMKENKITSELFLYNGNTFVEDNSISGVLQNGETE